MLLTGQPLILHLQQIARATIIVSCHHHEVSVSIETQLIINNTMWETFLSSVGVVKGKGPVPFHYQGDGDDDWGTWLADRCLMSWSVGSLEPVYLSPCPVSFSVLLWTLFTPHNGSGLISYTKKYEKHFYVTLWRGHESLPNSNVTPIKLKCEKKLFWYCNHWRITWNIERTTVLHIPYYPANAEVRHLEWPCALLCLVS